VTPSAHITVPRDDAAIDVHHHMFPPALLAALSSAGVDRIGGEPVAASWSPEQSLELMDRYGIGAAVLSVPVSLGFLDADSRRALTRRLNEAGHDAARRWPARFGFFATLPLPDVHASVEELRYALDELGADGVGLLTNHEGIYQGDGRLDPVYAELDARDAVAFVHPTVPPSAPPLDGTGASAPVLQPSLLEFPFETTRAIATLLVSRMPERFPRIRPVFTHSGGCVTSVAGRLIDRRPIVAEYTATAADGGAQSIERIEELLERAQLDAADALATFHYDVALSTDQQALAGLTRLVPTSRLLLGTDYPMGQEVGAHVTLHGVESFPGFTAADRVAVRSGNAAQLFPRLARGRDAAGDGTRAAATR
jgi:predicted TIM-barrel fold metal-dependent hydrolase